MPIDLDLAQLLRTLGGTPLSPQRFREEHGPAPEVLGGTVSAGGALRHGLKWFSVRRGPLVMNVAARNELAAFRQALKREKMFRPTSPLKADIEVAPIANPRR